MLPLMLVERSVDLPQASWLATANYLSCLVGALLCMALPALIQRLGCARPAAAAVVRAGLATTVVFTQSKGLTPKTS